MTTAVDTKPAFKVATTVVNLLGLLSRVHGSVERRGTIPILRNIKLSVAGGKLTAQSTNLEMQSVSTIACEGDGEITVEADRTIALLRQMPLEAACELSPDARAGRLELRCGRASYMLPTLPAGDYPTFSTVGLSDPVEIDTEEFQNLLGMVAHAMETGEARQELSGIYLHADGALLRAVATDGHRLALAEMDAPKGYPNGAGVIIPRTSIPQITKVLEQAGERVSLRMSDGLLQIETPATTLTTRLVDGKFVNYHAFFRDDPPLKVVVERSLLMTIIQRALVVVSERSCPVRFDVSPGHVAIATVNLDGGQGHDEMEIAYDDDPFTVGFNGKLLLDVLGVIEHRDVEMHFAAPNASGRVMGATLILDPGNPRVKFLLVPLVA